MVISFTQLDLSSLSHISLFLAESLGIITNYTRSDLAFLLQWCPKLEYIGLLDRQGIQAFQGQKLVVR